MNTLHHPRPPRQRTKVRGIGLIDALIALAREEISSDRRPSVRAYEDEHNARIRSARARCDELGIEWREATS